MASEMRVEAHGGRRGTTRKAAKATNALSANNDPCVNVCLSVARSRRRTHSDTHRIDVCARVVVGAIESVVDIAKDGGKQHQCQTGAEEVHLQAFCVELQRQTAEATAHPSRVVRRRVFDFAVKRRNADVTQHRTLLAVDDDKVVLELLRRVLGKRRDKVDLVVQPDGDDAAVEPAKEHALHERHVDLVDLIVKVGKLLAVRERRKGANGWIQNVDAREEQHRGQTCLDTDSTQRGEKRCSKCSP